MTAGDEVFLGHAVAGGNLQSLLVGGFLRATLFCLPEECHCAWMDLDEGHRHEEALPQEA